MPISFLAEWHLVCIFAGIAGLVFSALALLRRGDGRIEDRVDGMAARMADRSRRDGPVRQPAGRLSRLLATIGSHGGAYQTALRERLHYAGYDEPKAMTTLVVVQYLGALTLTLLTAWICHRRQISSIDSLLMLVFAACTGFLLPSLWLSRRKAARQRVLNRSLPDFLDLLIACLEAGLTLEGGIQRISGELTTAHPELGREIVRVQREMEMGTATDRALHNFAQRTDMEVLRSLATVCSQARRFGTKVAVALRIHADTLRTQREEFAEEAAQKASVKILIPTLLLLFPATFVVLAGPAMIQIYDNFVSASGIAK